MEGESNNGDKRGEEEKLEDEEEIRAEAIAAVAGLIVFGWEVKNPER